MSKRCDITGVGCQFGQNVSHAKNATKRVWNPNAQSMRLYSKSLGYVAMKVTPSGLRTLEKHGGLDGFLLTTLDSKLTKICKKLKALVVANTKEDDFFK